MELYTGDQSGGLLCGYKGLKGLKTIEDNI